MTKVLVFENDPSFAGELRTELGRMGCTVQLVDDGNHGLQVAAADRPDLILLSIELPRMNGFSVCNKLKKDAHLKDVPLVIMSSESSEETFEQHRKLRTRAEDYVHKPIAFGDLLQHVRAFVKLDEHREGDLDRAELLDPIGPRGPAERPAKRPAREREEQPDGEPTVVRGVPGPSELAARRQRAAFILEEISEARAKRNRNAAGLQDYGQGEHPSERLAKDVLAMAAEIECLKRQVEDLSKRMAGILHLASPPPQGARPGPPPEVKEVVDLAAELLET